MCPPLVTGNDSRHAFGDPHFIHCQMSECFQMKDFCFPPGVYKTKLKVVSPSFSFQPDKVERLEEKSNYVDTVSCLAESFDLK